MRSAQPVVCNDGKSASPPCQHQCARQQNLSQELHLRALAGRMFLQGLQERQTSV